MSKIPQMPVTDAAELTESAVEWVMDVQVLQGAEREQAITSAIRLCEAAQAILKELPPAAYADTLKQHIALTQPLREDLKGQRFLWRALKDLIPSRHMLAIRAERDAALNRPKRVHA